MIQYPTELDKEVILCIIDIVGDGDIIERKDEFGLAIWNIQGVLQAAIFGEPKSIVESDDLMKLKIVLEGVLEDGLPAEFNPIVVMEIIRLILVLVNFLLDSES